MLDGFFDFWFNRRNFLMNMRPDKMKEAKKKTGAFCAYQERTQQEVRDKLYALGLYRNEVENVLTELITEDFVNEERYAKAFAGGRFRMKQWGRRKIEYALKQKNISPYCIEKGLEEISDEDYEKVIVRLIEKRMPDRAKIDYKSKSNVARYIIGKGFEPELVWTLIEEKL